jgi:hypothetical protein
MWLRCCEAYHRVRQCGDVALCCCWCLAANFASPLACRNTKTWRHAVYDCRVLTSCICPLPLPNAAVSALHDLPEVRYAGAARQYSMAHNGTAHNDMMDSLADCLSVNSNAIRNRQWMHKTKRANENLLSQGAARCLADVCVPQRMGKYGVH